jgi:ribose transport system permease protein
VINGLKRHSDLLGRAALCVLLAIGFSIAIPNFLAQSNTFAILQVVAPIGLAALGVSVTMLAGEVDLSIGSMAVLGGIVAVRLAGHGAALAVCVTLALGILLGAIQGLLISRLRMSSLVLTIGTLILLSGCAYLLSGNAAVSLGDFRAGEFLSSRYWVFSPVSLTFLALTALIWLGLNRSRYGHEIYAIGGGRREAEAAGVRTRRPLMLAFGVSGGMGALTGALVSLSTGGATPTGFSAVLLNSIAAAVIGGIALSGGRGSVWGVAMGALALGFISNGVNVLGAQVYVSQFLTGGLLLAALATEVVVGRGHRRPALTAGRKAALPTRPTSEVSA